MTIYLEWLLAAALIAQFLWVVLRHFTKFRRYKKLWDIERERFLAASVRFNEAQRQRDLVAMNQHHLVCQQAYNTQVHLMRAQAAVMNDNFIWPWQWLERWDADYLEETVQ